MILSVVTLLRRLFEPYRDSIIAQIFLQIGDGYFVEMEDRGCQTCISLSASEHVTEMLHAPRPTRRYDRDGEALAELRQSLAGEAVLGAIVIHGCEENLAGTAFLSLMRPVEKPFLCVYSPTMYSDDPLAVLVLPSVYGHSDELAAEVVGEIGDELRVLDGGRVDGHLVSASGQKPVGVSEFAYSAAHGEGDIYVACYALNELGESLTPLVSRGDVKKDKLVSPLAGILRTEFHGVTHILDIDKVDTFDSLAVADVETWNDTFGEHWDW